jgi:hypothetical protein
MQARAACKQCRQIACRRGWTNPSSIGLDTVDLKKTTRLAAFILLPSFFCQCFQMGGKRMGAGE